MTVGSKGFPGIYRYWELPWVRRNLRPVKYASLEDVEIKKRESAHVVPEEEGELAFLGLESCTGKITDAGYDQMLCQYFRLPSNRDLRFSAILRVDRYPETRARTGQEGGGLFFRDNMELDRNTGLPYSNMLLAGVYLGRWSGFLRSGIRDSIENVKNERHFFPGDPSPGTEAEITLEKTGNRVRVVIRPACNPAEIEEFWETTSEENIFQSRDREWIYVGFFAANDCAVAIRKDSVCLEIRKGKKSLFRKKRATESGRVLSSLEKMQPENSFPDVPKEIFASPEGGASGVGTRAAPWDLVTAVERCRPGQTVLLLPGRYQPEKDILLRGGAGKKLFCDTAGGEYAVLDFRGEDRGVVIPGHDWELRNIAVVRGLGFQISGKDNRLYGCAAAHNLETGFLIRHPQNDSSRELWPSGNLISDCVSFCNRDPAEKNADGFACKVAAGEGNAFVRCRAFLNSDDGFDLFTKNRPTGAVHLEGCVSLLNGYTLEDGTLRVTKGNGCGFKLGGSGQRIPHKVVCCQAFGNKQYGFTSNSNPWLFLEGCCAMNNKKQNYNYYFTALCAKVEKNLRDCSEYDEEDFDPRLLLEETVRKEQLWTIIQEAID